MIDWTGDGDYYTMSGRTVHVKIKVKGNRKKILLFHMLVGNRDHDWPWFKTTLPTCKTCGGAIYSNPIFDLPDLKKLSTQINEDKEIDGHLSVKVTSWLAPDKCEAKHGTR